MSHWLVSLTPFFIPFQYLTSLPIVCHYCVTLYLVCFALVLGVVVIKISRNQNKKGSVPSLCRTVIDSWYGSLLGVTNPRASQKSSQELKDGHFDDNQTSSDDHQIINSTNVHQSSSAENEFYWSLLGTLIDRTAFVVFLVIFVVMTLKHFM